MKVLSPSTRYRTTKIEGRKIHVHRMVMEQKLGRPLRTDEFVHHKNHNKLDNRPENLELMDPVSHGRLHHLKYPLTKTCTICGREFTPFKTRRKRQKTCGNPDCKRESIGRSQRGFPRSAYGKKSS